MEATPLWVLQFLEAPQKHSFLSKTYALHTQDPYEPADTEKQKEDKQGEVSGDNPCLVIEAGKSSGSSAKWEDDYMVCRQRNQGKRAGWVLSCSPCCPC